MNRFKKNFEVILKRSWHVFDKKIYKNIAAKFEVVKSYCS